MPPRGGGRVYCSLERLCDRLCHLWAVRLPCIRDTERDNVRDRRPLPGMVAADQIDRGCISTSPGVASRTFPNDYTISPIPAAAVRRTLLPCFWATGGHWPPYVHARACVSAYWGFSVLSLTDTCSWHLHAGMHAPIIAHLRTQSESIDAGFEVADSVPQLLSMTRVLLHRIQSSCWQSTAGTQCQHVGPLARATHRDVTSHI